MITSKGAKERGWLDYLGIKNFLLFDNVEPNPSLETVKKIIDKFPDSNLVSKKKRRIKAINTRLKRILYFVELFSPYTTLDCRFQMGKMLNLYDSLSTEERQTFNVDVRSIDWKHYYQEIACPLPLLFSFQLITIIICFLLCIFNLRLFLFRVLLLRSRRLGPTTPRRARRPSRAARRAA